MLRALEQEIDVAGGGIDTTEAMHRLVERGAGVEKLYLAAQVSARKDLELFVSESQLIRADLRAVKSRLGGPLRPIAGDPERTANIERWRHLSTELPERLDAFVNAASALCETMCGITVAEIAQIDAAAKSLKDWISQYQTKLKKAQEQEDAGSVANYTRSIANWEVVLHVLRRQLGRD
jgi:hypothetical protein